jgi:hypothetical protein
MPRNSLHMTTIDALTQLLTNILVLQEGMAIGGTHISLVLFLA